MTKVFLLVLLDDLRSLLQRQVGLIMCVDEEMEKLFNTLTTIDAQGKQIESKPIQNWLRELDDLAYEIGVILGECATQVSQPEKKNSKLGLRKILFQYKIRVRMKDMAEKLDIIAIERQKFHLQEMQKQSGVAAGCAVRETGSALSDSREVYGRDEEKKKIVGILVFHVGDIGIGGLGKATLAQLVFNDQMVDNHFNTKLYVCISDDFDLKNLVKGMIESAIGSQIASNLMYLNALQGCLPELLNQKRYLLIFDDVWNEDQEKWAMLKNVLAYGFRGVSIVVTTPFRNVPDVMRILPARIWTKYRGTFLPQRQ